MTPDTPCDCKRAQATGCTWPPTPYVDWPAGLSWQDSETQTSLPDANLTHVYPLGRNQNEGPGIHCVVPALWARSLLSTLPFCRACGILLSPWLPTEEKQLHARIVWDIWSV